MKNTYGDKTRTDPAPMKAKMSRSAVKVMLTMFWDAEGILMADYLPTGRTMNSDYYSGLIKSLKKRTVKEKTQQTSQRPCLSSARKRTATPRSRYHGNNRKLRN